MLSLRPVSALALFFLHSAALAQVLSISVVNYEQISEVPAAPNVKATYRVIIDNTGPATPPVTAMVKSLSPGIKVSGPEMLQFPSVPANGVAASNNTVTFLISRDAQIDFSKLQWTFRAADPIARPGPRQVAPLGTPVSLNASASTNPGGSGPLRYQWKLISAPAGSGAVLKDASSVIASFSPDVDGNYEIQLTVSNGTASHSATTTVNTTQLPPPVANAGLDQTVLAGRGVILNGSGSTSPDDLPLTYSWSLTSRPSGSTAVLEAKTTALPYFVADKAGTYVAQLIVNDGVPSSPATTSVIAVGTTQTAAPIANAGAAQSVGVGTTVHLNGSGSSDPSGLPLTYSWTLLTVPSGSAARLSNPIAENPTFVADRSGAYVAQLIVSDARLTSAPATVSITTQNAAPTANAGQSEAVSVGTLVTLAGSGTDPQNLPLTYHWSLISKPSGSAAALSNPAISGPTFMPDLAGTYVAQLTVNDGMLTSAPSTVNITASSGSITSGGGEVLLPAGATISQSQSAALPLSLSEPAPSNVVVTLKSSDTSTLTISPSTVTISAGATSPISSPRATGVKSGSADITASASGFTSAVESVEITANTAGQLAFTPASIMINGTSTQSLTLSISSPAPAQGLAVELSSNASGVAKVPTSVSIPGNSSSVLVPVTGVSAGTATITASAANYQNTTASVTVYSNQGVSVTWYGACWVNATIYGVTGNFQAIDLLVSGQQPVELQGTLFYAASCDPSQGQDNMNDFGTLTNPGNIIQGFSHHPNVIPSSAMYWIGPQTGNGQCAPGAPCSGCVNYTKKTPSCSNLP